MSTCHGLVYAAECSFRLIDSLELNPEALRQFLMTIQRHYREVCSPCCRIVSTFVCFMR